MQLNIDIIQERLPSEYCTKRYGPANRSYQYSRPLLYGRNLSFQEGNLYVAQSEDIPRQSPPKGCAVIAVGSHVPKEWLLGGIELLVITGSDGILSVFNHVQIIYNQFDYWDSQLRDELEKEMDFDLCRIMYLGSQITGRSINVVDRYLQSIFYTIYQKLPNGTSEIQVTKGSSPFSVEYAEKIKEVCNLERIITVPYLTGLALNGNSYCKNLYLDGQFTGCISISEEDIPFAEGDYPVMDYFFSFFQKAFLKYLRSYGQTEKPGLDALRNVLNHIPLSRQEIQMLALGPDEHWLCFKLKARRTEKFLPYEYMYANLNALLPQNIYALLQNHEIIGLLKIQKEDSINSDKTLDYFGEYIQRMGYYSGLSNPFIDFENINDYLLQASYAAEKGSSFDSPLHFFCDDALSYLLFSCTGEMATKSLLSQGLLALQNYDGKKGTEYTKTLDVYLKNEMSVTRTSEALFIHRSSLLKRLDKIQKLIQDDLKDPDVRLYYRLCLALLYRTE